MDTPTKAAEAANWLKRELDLRKSKNPSYSLRAFARKLEVPPGNLSQILNGKKPISPKIGRRIAKNLKLPESVKNQFLSTLDMGIPSKIFPIHTATPEISAINFIGRAELTSKLEGIFGQDHPWVSACLYGEKGVGKTALALKLMESPVIQNKFKDGLIWINVSDQESIQTQLRLLCQSLNPEISGPGLLNSTYCRDFLRNYLASKQMVIVFDSVSSINLIEEIFIGGKNCATIILTDNEDLAKDIPCKFPIQVPHLETNEALKIVEDYLPGLPDTLKPKIINLCELVGNLPRPLIALSQLLRKSYWKKQDRRLKETIDFLTNILTAETLPPSGTSMPIDGVDTVVEPLKSLFSLKYNNLSLAARILLEKLACFSPAPNTFTEEMVVDGLKTPVEKLDELVDEGLIEIDSQCRYSIPLFGYSWIQKSILPTLELDSLGNYFLLMMQKQSFCYDKEHINISNTFEMLIKSENKDFLAQFSLAFCRASRDNGQFPRAIEVCKRTIQTLETDTQSKGYLKAYSDLTRTYYHMDRYDLALDSALKMLSKIDESVPNAELFSCYTELAAIGFRTGDVQLADEFLRKLDEFPNKEAFYEENLTYIYLKSEVFATQGNFNSALAVYKTLLSECRKNPDSRFTLFVLSGIGRIYLLRMEGIQALESFTEYYNLIKARKLKAFIPFAYIQLANAEKVLGNYQKSEAWFSKSKEYMDKHGFEKFRLLYWLDYADFNLLKGDLTKAKLALEAFASADKDKIKYYEAAYNFLQGEYFARQGEYREALRFYHRACDITENSGFEFLSCRFRIQAAKAYIKHGELSRGCAILEDLEGKINQEEHIFEFLEFQVTKALAANARKDKKITNSLVKEIKLQINQRKVNFDQFTELSDLIRLK